VVLELRKMENKNVHTCSFCWKDSRDIKFMIAGPDMVNICEDCVEVCARIIEERKESRKRKPLTSEQIQDLSEKHGRFQFAQEETTVAFVRDIEKMHGIGGR